MEVLSFISADVVFIFTKFSMLSRPIFLRRILIESLFSGFLCFVATISYSLSLWGRTCNHKQQLFSSKLTEERWSILYELFASDRNQCFANEDANGSWSSHVLRRLVACFYRGVVDAALSPFVMLFFFFLVNKGVSPLSNPIAGLHRIGRDG